MSNCTGRCNQGRNCTCGGKIEETGINITGTMNVEPITTGHITWDASAPIEMVPHVSFKKPGETALTVTADGQFIWADNADELIERADGATRHILIALREIRK